MNLQEVIPSLYLFTGANVRFDSISSLAPDESQSSIFVCPLIFNLPQSGSEVNISVTLAAIDGTALGEYTNIVLTC